jgi:hypothetical protein
MYKGEYSMCDMKHILKNKKIVLSLHSMPKVQTAIYSTTLTNQRIKTLSKIGKDISIDIITPIDNK